MSYIHGWEYDENTPVDEQGWRDGGMHFRDNDRVHFEFTIDEIKSMYHESGSAGTHYVISIQKHENGKVREYRYVNAHMTSVFKMFKRELVRARNGQPPTQFIAEKARDLWWVNPKLCNPIIDSESIEGWSQKKHKKKLIA